MSRPKLLAPVSVYVLALALAATPLLHADDPPAITAPPGYKVVYHDMGNGTRMPILVKEEASDSNLHSELGDDPLDHQKVFSETNAMANKTFAGADTSAWDKSSSMSNNTDAIGDKVYNNTQPTSVYDVGSKSTFNVATYDGVKSAPGADSTFVTKTADTGNNEASSEFAAIGASEQNQSSPIGDKAYAVSADAMADKTFQGPEEEARHRHLKIASNGQLLINSLPDRPLSIDEVKSLINHGFTPNLSQPPPPASKPLNDPNYQPEPLRIEPTKPETPPPAANTHVDDDDKDDPVPSPGTMADPGPLPNK